MSSQISRALVVGGGVVGLTTARALQKRGVDVVVRALARGEDATSGGAGGYWMLFHCGLTPEATGARWAGVTLDEYLGTAEDPLVEQMPAFYLFDSGEAPELPLWGRTIERCKMRRVNGREALEAAFEAAATAGVTPPAGYESAWQFETVVVDCPKYLRRLESDIATDGGELAFGVEVEDLAKTAQTLGCDAVVNCTGLSGPDVARDDAFPSIPGKGVIARYARPSVRPEGFMSSSPSRPPNEKKKLRRLRAVITAEGGPLASPTEPAYFIPRGELVVVGGTYFEGDSDESYTPRELQRYATHAKAFAPDDLGNAEPLSVWTGLRPVRPQGVRLEVHHPTDAEADASSERSVAVAHNYGHGGSGWTIAWGCAEDLADALSGAPRLRKAAA